MKPVEGEVNNKNWRASWNVNAIQKLFDDETCSWDSALLYLSFCCSIRSKQKMKIDIQLTVDFQSEASIMRNKLHGGRVEKGGPRHHSRAHKRGHARHQAQSSL
jgi:hypothetical protein